MTQSCLGNASYADVLDQLKAWKSQPPANQLAPSEDLNEDCRSRIHSSSFFIRTLGLVVETTCVSKWRSELPE